MTRTRALALLALVALTIAGVACSDDDSVETGDGSPTTGEGAPDDVLISIEVGGGFVPQGTDFASVPTLVLRDGTVITGGASIAIYPGGPVSPVVTGQLGVGAVAALVDAAAEAGLDADALDAGEPGVADAPTTTITVAFADATRTHEVYALGMDDGPGLTDDQRAVRRAVGELVDQVTDAVGTAADQPYEPIGYQVQALPRSPADLEGFDVAPNELAWPFPDLPLSAEGCIDIEGDRVAELTDVLADATQITTWTDAQGALWQLAIRLTLPGDTRCSP
jgi:hypothetical protein